MMSVNFLDWNVDICVNETTATATSTTRTHLRSWCCVDAVHEYNPIIREQIPPDSLFYCLVSKCKINVGKWGVCWNAVTTSFRVFLPILKVVVPGEPKLKSLCLSLIDCDYSATWPHLCILNLITSPNSVLSHVVYHHDSCRNKSVSVSDEFISLFSECAIWSSNPFIVWWSHEEICKLMCGLYPLVFCIERAILFAKAKSSYHRKW